MYIFKSLYGRVLKHMLHEELLIFKQSIIDESFNVSIWVFCMLIIAGSFLASSTDSTLNFASFMLAGCVATMGLFRAYPTAFRLINDFEGERSIDFYLTLPIPSWLAMVKIMISVALQSIVFSLFVLPLGTLFIWGNFNVSTILWAQFFMLLFLASIFYGVFSLWITSKVSTLIKLTNVWSRFIFPLWFLGGFQYTWVRLHVLSKPLSYVALLNPVTYAMEGIRASLLGQEGYIVWWICVIALVVFTGLLYRDTLSRLKKRLDYV
jgi:ABC-type polysaccharide/polyol phosphate export permease